MISLKSIQTWAPFPKRETSFRKRRRLVLSFCNSHNSDQQPPPPQGGDKRKQELLARIAMLQTQKVRLTDYLDERSDYLTQFAEEANTEINLIGENALKELDEAGARIMGNIESQMQAFEDSMGMNKLEIEENEKKVEDFEGRIEEDRNEGLFFKNLREKNPVEMAKAKEEAEKIKELTKKSGGSVFRRNIYLALMGLVVVGIADAAASASPDWRKVAFLGVVLAGLLTQLVLLSLDYETGNQVQ